MAREQLSLDGIWQFHYVGEIPRQSAPPEDVAWRDINVPQPWQAAHDDLRYAVGIAWYRRMLTIPPAWRGKRVLLRFGAVYYHALIWVNGRYMGDDANGWTPFECDITDALTDSQNTLHVQVVLPSDDAQTYPDYPFSEVPHGKQSWYGQWGGIWQSVYLESRSPQHIAHVHIDSDIGGTVRPTIELAQPTDATQQAHISVLTADGTVVTQHTEKLISDDPFTSQPLQIPEPQLWWPVHIDATPPSSAPYLYTLRVMLSDGSGLLDSVEKRFGLREISKRDGWLYLNGEKLYLRGALDQGYYPDTLATPPDKPPYTQLLKQQFEQARALGLNCLRMHIKVPDPRYLDLADELGLLIWLDLPNVGHLSEPAKQRLHETLRRMLRRDAHHPSIIIWTLVNEDWGTDLVHDPSHRQWLRDEVAALRRLDPTRLIVDNSPCYPNQHVTTDIEDYHYYRAYPDNAADWDATIAAFAGRQADTFAPDGQCNGDEPLIVSEFGNWGLPDVDLLRDAAGNLPWWFQTGAEWADGVMLPHGVQERFRQWGLWRVFGDWKTLVYACQRQQADALSYEIETMRLHPEITGYVITELTDVHWESNGLLDMRRNPRYLGIKNRDDALILRPERWSYRAGDTVHIRVWMHRVKPVARRAVRVRWRAGQINSEGNYTLDLPAAGHVIELPPIIFQVPEIQIAWRDKLVCSLTLTEDAAAGWQTSGEVSLSFYPEKQPRTIPIKRADDDIRDWLQAANDNLIPDSDNGFIITHTLDNATIQAIQRGARALILVDSPDALPQTPTDEAVASRFPYAQVKLRAGSIWSGDWASSFSWLRRDGLFADIPGGPLFDHSFIDIIPHYVLAGFSPLDYARNVHAGLFVGWLHKHSAIIGKRNYGKGVAVLTTLRLPSTLPDDPLVTTLLDGLLTLLAG
jgi:hypothetical protein